MWLFSKWSVRSLPARVKVPSCPPTSVGRGWIGRKYCSDKRGRTSRECPERPGRWRWKEPSADIKWSQLESAGDIEKMWQTQTREERCSAFLGDYSRLSRATPSSREAWTISGNVTLFSSMQTRKPSVSSEPNLLFKHLRNQHTYSL